ncbi:hypothetical protein DES36_1193 [Alkalibaculum bacchi]|uniref:Uncharacterized protein n=1 Tax=Alkalibaculum bacchi TaxID=645887 RepID=A0A366I1E9_9FIRM|nr:hypothetical protein [Alkalibaculum bacchi]RBP59278.1 hypothetical protein DES36_1193 [Alkalibaculum bacchi]
MFKVTFSDVDKKILKLVKALKSKKGHSLYEAKDLVKKIFEHVAAVDGRTKLTITLSDLDNELNYVFENIIINDSKEPNLLEIFENEIIASGHENARKIITEIQKDYQNELSNGAISNKGPNKNHKKPKLFKGLKRKKESQKDWEETQSEIEEDFGDLTVETSLSDNYQPNIQDTGYSTMENSEIQESLIDDFKEINDKEDDFFKREVPLDEILDNEIKEDSFYTVDSESREDIITEVEEIKINDSFDDLSEHYGDHELEQQEVFQKRNDRITFPVYDSYLNLSQVENSIKRHKKRFEKENLVKFLGLNAVTENEIITELDNIKLNYALNALDDTQFILLKDLFFNEIEDKRDQTQTQLAGIYDQAMNYDYEGVAKEKLEEEYQSLVSETERIYYEYVDQQEQEYNLKLEKFIHEQEKALEEFKKQQALDKGIYTKELDSKKSARIELYYEDKQKELDSKKEKLLDDEMFELKNQYINQLTECKRVSIRSLEIQLDNIMDEVWTKTEEALILLKNNIEKNIPFWKQDIIERQEIEDKAREEQRRQEELRLEKERIELQRRQLELRFVKKEEDKSETDDLIQKKFSEYEEKLNSLLMIQKEGLSYGNVINHNQNQSKESNISKNILNKIMLPALVIVIMVFGTGMFLGKSFNDNSQTSQQAQYGNLEENIKTIEEILKIKGSEQTNQADDLDSLLKNKNYEKAMSLYKDSESLEKIEEALFQNDDLAMLIIFNKTSETTFGKLDEALLSREGKKAKEIYEKMSDEEKKELSNDRKSDLALLFYQKGEKDLASTLLEN